MGNRFSICFTHSRWIQQEEEEEEEENKHHHEQLRNRISGDLSGHWIAGEENKHHEKQNSNDRISDLPDDILLLILSFLPFKSVGQTSVLSRRWSHVWSSYPIFDFHEIFTDDEAVHLQARARIINTVLARKDENYNILNPHRSTSWRRILDQPQRVEGATVDDEELLISVRLRSESQSKLPQCRLNCHTLRSSSCGRSKAWLGFPSTYVVWSYLLALQDLSLTHVDFSDSAFSGEDLFFVSSFPFLRRLSILSCRGITALKICCPYLNYVTVVGLGRLYSIHISGMRLEHLGCYGNCIDGWVDISAPNLKYLYWGNDITGKCSILSFPTPKTSSIGHLNRSSLTTTKIYHRSVINLLSHSSQVEMLYISDQCLPVLSDICSKFDGLPFSFGKLETLQIIFHYSGMKKGCIRGIACLLKSSPVVHTLEIMSLEYGKWNNSLLKAEAHQYLRKGLSHIKVVSIILAGNISENAVAFAELLLKYGNGLQEMIISSLWSRSLLSNFLDDTIALLKSFPRASADIKFLTSRY